MATQKKCFFDDDNIALRLTKKLPKKARGFKKQLATMYLDKDPVKRIVACILHSAHLHDTNCFILSRRLLEELVENDPNLDSGSNIRIHYIAVCGLLNRKFATYIKLNKAASVYFLHPEILEILQISGTSFQPGCKKYIQKKGISDFENWRKFKQLRLKDEEDKLISADSQEVLDAKIETLRDMYGPEIASWEQYLLDMPKNERLILLDRAKRDTNAH